MALELEEDTASQQLSKIVRSQPTANSAQLGCFFLACGRNCSQTGAQGVWTGGGRFLGAEDGFWVRLHGRGQWEEEGR